MKRPLVFAVQPPMHDALAERLTGTVDFRTASRPEPATLVTEARDAVCLVARAVPEPIGADVFDRMPHLRCLAVIGSGADCYDIAAATDRGLPIANNAGVASGPVAEYVVGCMTVLYKGVLADQQRFLDGTDWDRRPSFAGRELADKLLAVVGYGQIGRRVARMARDGLGMRVVAYDPYAPDVTFAEGSVQRAQTLGDALRGAAVVTVHVPRAPETLGLLGEAELGLLGDGAVVVNSSRGGIVDEGAVLAAVSDGRLAGAAIDVFDQEPPTGPLERFRPPNVIATPHSAGITVEGIMRLHHATADNVLAMLAGERPSSLVDPDAWPGRAGAVDGPADG